VNARSRALLVAGGLLACQLAGPRTHAHPDARIFDETLHLAPGEAVVRPMALHFHRLVATWTSDRPDADGLWLLVVPAEAPGAAAWAPEDAWFAARLAGPGRLSHLVDCCLHVPYRHLLLVVRNDGATPAALDLRAWAVHDEFAVVAARAEPGAVEVPLALFAALGAVAVAVAVRARGRFGAPGPPRGRALTWSAGLFAAALGMAATLGVAGTLRYGGGPIDGLIAVLVDLPVPAGPFGSRAAFLLGVLLLAWLAAIGAWVLAVGQGAHRHAPWAVPLGGALAIVSLAGGIAMAWTYGGSLVPAALGVVLAGPLAGSALLLRGVALAAPPR
jgi:hypothetical protein